MIDFAVKHDVWIKNDDGTLSRMDEPYFRSWKLADGVWRILSSGDYSYLVEGDDEALAIDSGYGAGNIREYMQTLTDKPVRCIANTHDHFDHTANNSYFETAYMSAETKPLATIPFPSFAGIDFPRDYPITVLQDGDYIPLKGRELQAFLIPDHAVGSMAYLDRKGRILFSGDEFMGSKKRIARGLTSWIHSLEKLAAVRDQFDVMYGGAFTMDASVVDRMLICAKNALQNGGEPMSSFGGPGGMHKKPHTDSPDGRVVYGRMMPHPEDQNHNDGSKSQNMYHATYEDIELIYDITKVDM